jgi:hypothetical protein
MWNFLKDGLSRRKYMTPNMDFMNVGNFLIQQIHVFQETSLQILSESECVMRFGTKIFIFTAYVYSQMLRLHANCAYVFSNVKRVSSPKHCWEILVYIADATDFTISISTCYFFCTRIVCLHHIMFFLQTVYFNSSIQRAPQTCTRTHTHLPALKQNLWWYDI